MNFGSKSRRTWELVPTDFGVFTTLTHGEHIPVPAVVPG